MSFEIFLSRMVLAAGELAVSSGHSELQSAVIGLKVDLIQRDLFLVGLMGFGLYCYQHITKGTQKGTIR